MELALVRLLGSGISIVSTAYGIQVPEDATRNGYATIDYLSRHDGALMKTLADSVVDNMWVSLRHAKMPKAAALKTVNGLPAIIDAHSPPTSYFVSALVNTGVASKKSGGDVNAPGRAVAAETVMRAREENAFEKSGLNEQLCFFFLERLYSRLLLERSFFEALKPALQSFLNHQHWQDEAGSPSPVAGGAMRKTTGEKAKDNSIAGNQCDAVAEFLPVAPLSDPSKEFDNLLATANLSAMQDAVKQYREQLTDAEQSGDAAALTHLRLRLGRLLTVIGESVRDIALLEQAVTQLELGLGPVRERVQNTPRSFKSRMALGNALWQLGELQSDEVRSQEAIMQIDRLCAVLPASCDDTIWVNANCYLAAMSIAQAEGLQSLGPVENIDASTQALKRAALAFQSALQRVSRNDDPMEWATLTNQLASVIWAVGDRTEDYDYVSRAAEMKMAALETFEAQGDDVTAELVRDELIGVQEVLQRIEAQAGPEEAQALADIKSA